MPPQPLQSINRTASITMGSAAAQFRPSHALQAAECIAAASDLDMALSTVLVHMLGANAELALLATG